MVWGEGGPWSLSVLIRSIGPEQHLPTPAVTDQSGEGREGVAAPGSVLQGACRRSLQAGAPGAGPHSHLDLEG